MLLVGFRHTSHDIHVYIHIQCFSSELAMLLSTSGRLGLFLTSQRSLFSHSACQDVSLSPTFTNLKQNYSVIACGYEDKAKGRGRTMADRKGWKGERGRFWNSFSISWMWGQEFRANKNKNKMFQPDPIFSRRGGFKAENTLPQLVPVPHVCLFLWRSLFSPHSRVSDSRPGRRKEFRSKGNTLYPSLGSASTLRSHRMSDLMLRCSLHKGPMKLN